MKLLLAAALFVLLSAGAFADSVPFSKDYLPHRVITVMAGDQIGSVEIDTGSDMSSLPVELLIGLVEHGKAKPVGMETFGLADRTTMKQFIYMVDDFAIGHCVLHNIMVAGGGDQLLGIDVLDKLSPWSFSGKQFVFTCPLNRK